MIDELILKLETQGYNHAEAKSLSQRLAAAEIIREQLLCWLETDVETDCRYEEFSVFALMRERGFTYPNALNTIAWLYRNPEAARKALASGTDRITRGER